MLEIYIFAGRIIVVGGRTINSTSMDPPPVSEILDLRNYTIKCNGSSDITFGGLVNSIGLSSNDYSMFIAFGGHMSNPNLTRSWIDCEYNMYKIHNQGRQNSWSSQVRGCLQLLIFKKNVFLNCKKQFASPRKIPFRRPFPGSNILKIWDTSRF